MVAVRAPRRCAPLPARASIRQAARVGERRSTTVRTCLGAVIASGATNQTSQSSVAPNVRAALIAIASIATPGTRIAPATT